MPPVEHFHQPIDEIESGPQPLDSDLCGRLCDEIRLYPWQTLDDRNKAQGLIHRPAYRFPLHRTARSWIMAAMSIVLRVLIGVGTAAAYALAAGIAGGLASLSLYAAAGGLSRPDPAPPGSTLLQEMGFCFAVGFMPAAPLGAVLGVPAAIVRRGWVKALLLGVALLLGTLAGIAVASVFVLMMVNAAGD